jgi:hypothetical protein
MNHVNNVIAITIRREDFQAVQAAMRDEYKVCRAGPVWMDILVTRGDCARVVMAGIAVAEMY